jgi:hypothetical protein
VKDPRQRLLAALLAGLLALGAVACAGEYGGGEEQEEGEEEDD